MHVTIRKAEYSDLTDILRIYTYAREQMRRNGNPAQWGSSQPSEDILIEDIQNRNLYVMCDNSGHTGGVFAFIAGDEPTYQTIEGSWLNDLPYGTLHRVAGDGTMRGIVDRCIAYCGSLCSNIRVDTHQCNKIMQHLLEKNGFVKCGIIYVRDHAPRIAYQRMIKHQTDNCNRNT